MKEVEQKMEQQTQQEVEQRVEVTEEDVEEFLESVPLKKKKEILKEIEKLKNWGMKINTSCCNHYSDKKYSLSYFEDTNVPFAHCENCGEFQFIGTRFQWLRFKLATLFEPEFAVCITDVTLLDLDEDWRWEVWREKGIIGRDGSNKKKKINEKDVKKRKGDKPYEKK